MKIDASESEFREIVTASGSLETLPERLRDAFGLEFREEGEELPEEVGEVFWNPTMRCMCIRTPSGWRGLFRTELEGIARRYSGLEAAARELERLAGHLSLVLAGSEEAQQLHAARRCLRELLPGEGARR